jgi:hypothetical protein
MAQRKRIKRDDLVREIELIEQAGKIIKEAGFTTHYAAGSRGARPLDLTFETATGDVIGVECKGWAYDSDRKVQAFLEKISTQFGPLSIKEVVFVAPEFPVAVQDTLDAYIGIEFVEIGRLKDFLRRYQVRRATTRRRGTVVQRVRTHRDEILTASAGLAALIDEKLQELGKQRPNSEEATGARDASISDYETLKAEVEELQQAVVKFTANKIQDQAIEKKVKSFGDTVWDWWQKQSSTVLSTTSGIALFSLATTVGCLLGLNANLAAVLAASLVGGKKVTDAIRKLPKDLS